MRLTFCILILGCLLAGVLLGHVFGALLRIPEDTP